MLKRSVEEQQITKHKADPNLDYLIVSLLNDDHGISWQSMIFLLSLLSERDRESVLNHVKSTEYRWYLNKESVETLIKELKNN